MKIVLKSYMDLISINYTDIIQKESKYKEANKRLCEYGKPLTRQGWKELTLEGNC
jgi:hypothetical protein